MGTPTGCLSRKRIRVGSPSIFCLQLDPTVQFLLRRPRPEGFFRPRISLLISCIRAYS